MPPTSMPTLAAPPPLWSDPMPRHFDTRIPVWLKILLLITLTVLAYFFLDQRLAVWAHNTRPLPEINLPQNKQDIARELMFLEQWGQVMASVLVITAVALLDPAGRRRALALSIACLATVAFTYLFKDLLGRSRPFVVAADGAWQWAGPAQGFTGGARWTSFPSAHTTAAFALSSGLSWFYPRARGLFMALATITAAQRILHSAHYLSDVIAGLGLAVFITRATLHAKLAGRLIALAPPNARAWWLTDTR